MIRYYKASDGVFTVFRSTATREYRSAWIQHGRAPLGSGLATRVANFGFSAKHAHEAGAPRHATQATGQYPAVEISKAEYDDLKLAQKQRWGGSLKHCGPRDSWVRNEGLNEVKARIVGL
jgi:hypothetical protein